MCCKHRLIFLTKDLLIKAFTVVLGLTCGKINSTVSSKAKLWQPKGKNEDDTNLPLQSVSLPRKESSFGFGFSHSRQPVRPCTCRATIAPWITRNKFESQEIYFRSQEKYILDQTKYILDHKKFWFSPWSGRQNVLFSSLSPHPDWPSSHNTDPSKAHSVIVICGIFRRVKVSQGKSPIYLRRNYRTLSDK